MKKTIKWNPEKAELIRKDETRGGFSFEECIIAIEGNGILDIVQNPSSNHCSQLVYVLNLEGYAYLVPFVETADEIFLKTMIPSRKHTALYLKR
jgi:hypothetical protein